MKFIVVFLVSINLVSCATSVNMKKLTTGELAYVESVKGAPTSFKVQKAEIDNAWGRGHNFINLYSGMKIQSSTDYKVSTYNPTSSNNGTIGYEMTKLVDGESVQFVVSCMHPALNFKYTPSVCKTNEKIMAYYMKTGKIMPQFVNKSFFSKKKKATEK